MFMNHAMHRAGRRGPNLADTAMLAAGLVFATVIALVALASAANAATATTMLDTDALARMLAAPALHPAPAVTRETLLVLMSAGLVGMGSGALAMVRGLERDWNADHRTRR